MLSQTPKESRGAFLLKFTEQLIKNTEAAQLIKLEEVLHEILPDIQKEPEKVFTKEELKEKIREKIQEKPKEIAKKENLNQEIKFTPRRVPNTLQIIQNQKRVLKLPEPRLPSTMSYLRPQPTGEILDLKKLNVFIQDPNVNIIECLGQEKPIIVNGSMGRKSTETTLTNEEIEEILNTFSQKSRIPISTGVTKIVAGSLILTATKTPGQDTQFVIKKMTRNPQFIPSPR